ncbi:MAG TPA: PIN domain-containing protein [Sedimentisphaerales bacterium]|jgi:predicted nucleic acid-binding protein|nr:PIN domain-containing protein [Sedimentisphaerales bacterium]HNU30975.1 PIN domain-containing protein [Sedimentisphaerales bacterium]
MKVLVDTCVWSKVLRRKAPDKDLAGVIEDLIRDGRIVLIGPIRQELLSGVPNPSQFDILRKTLDAFEDISLRTEHFIRAAQFSNQCRSKGVQGSTIDFLICAVAAVEGLQILTTDSDFLRYAKHLPIRLSGVTA